MNNVQIISTNNLQQRLRQGDLQFWNVLEDENFTGEVIPGSRRVPLSRVGREAAEIQLPKDAEIVVYCTKPQCPVSKWAAQKLVEFGYTNVWAYKGGLEEWKKAGLDIEQISIEPNTA